MNKKLGILIFMAVMAAFLAASVFATPVVENKYPSDGANLTTNDITFNYTVYDTSPSILYCDLYLSNGSNWKNVSRDSSVTINATNEFYVEDVVASDYSGSWKFVCTNSNFEVGDSDDPFMIYINLAPYWSTHISDKNPAVQGILYSEQNIFNYVTDAPGDTLTFTISQENVSQVDCSVTTTGSLLTWRAASGFIGTGSCTVNVTDAGKLSAYENFSITSVPVDQSLSFSANDGNAYIDSAHKALIKYDQVNTTMTNDGNVDLTVTISSTSFRLNESEYIAAPAPQTISLAVGETKTIIWDLIVSGDPVVNPLGAYVGNLTFSYVMPTNMAGRSSRTWMQNATEETLEGVKLNINEAQKSLSVDPSTVEISAEANQTASSAFTVTNDGQIDLSGLQFVNISSGLSDFNITFNKTTLSLASGETEPVLATVHVPSNKESGTYSGTVNLTNGEYSKLFTITVDVSGMLSFYSIDICMDGSKDCDNDLESQDNIQLGKQPKPGNTITVKVKLRNEFSDSDDEITDIELTVTIPEIDDGEDLEESEDSIDIDGGDESKQYNLEFAVPYQVDSGPYSIEIVAEGEGPNGETERVTKEYSFEIDRKTHEVIISQAELGEAVLECSRSTDLNFAVLNIGEEDEDDARLEITSTGLDVNEEYEFELSSGSDDDAEYQNSLPIYIGGDINPGTYTITLKSYYDKDRSSADDTKQLTLQVKECGTSEGGEGESEGEEGETTVVETGGEGNQGTTVPATTTTGAGRSFGAELFGSDWYILLLVIVNVVLILGVIWAIVWLLRK